MDQKSQLPVRCECRCAAHHQIVSSLDVVDQNRDLVRDAAPGAAAVIQVPGPSNRPTSMKCHGPVTPFCLHFPFALRPIQSGQVAIRAKAEATRALDGSGLLPKISGRPMSSCDARINVTIPRRAAV